MSLHYLLDGYNVIRQMPASILRKFEDERIAFVAYIGKKKPQGSVRNAVTVVLDGYASALNNVHSIGIKIVQSGEISADQKIKNIVAGHANPKTIRVVTDDRALQYAVKAIGARVLSVEEFLAQGRPTAARKKGAKISGNVEERITAELTEIWLKRNKRDKK